jgi:uncharacterized protein
MTLAELKSKNCLLLESISGSRAYGTNIASSDTDIKGVYILPPTAFFRLDYPEQINDDGNNVSFFELRKFIDLLAKNNPNMLELLAVPDDCILFKHPLFDLIRPEIFLSKLCKESFAGYAMTQIKKARGLNKKVLNPMERERKTVLDFCYVIEGQGSVSLNAFLTRKQIDQKDCGLVAIPHMHDVYGLYHNTTAQYAGIVRGNDSMDIALSSVGKEETPIGILSFNKDGFSKYCKDYKAYWDWVEKRNEERFENTIAHGRNYDAKNMMHTFRLLDMCEEIGRSGKIEVRRNNRDYLLQIRGGDFSYDELLIIAENRLKVINEVYAQSKLPDVPNLEVVNELLVKIRCEFNIPN